MKNKKDFRLDRRYISCYKKNTLAIFFSFALTFLLLTTMVILLHTNHRIENIQQKTILTPADCYISELKEQQIKQLQKDKNIKNLAVTQQVDGTFQRNNQIIFMEKGDSEFTTMMSTMIDGRLAENPGEVVAEKWVLLNLGIEPKCGEKFQVLEPDTGEKINLTLVGILSDISMNKQYGVISLYTILDATINTDYIAYLQMEPEVNYDVKMKSLINELKIDEKQIKICLAKEDYAELYVTELNVIGVILLVCMVVFYGIFRITMVERTKQYGILRSIGMKRKQLQQMILSELYQIYILSVPIGVLGGILLALFISTISGDRDTIVYFYNERVSFEPIVPVGVILLCIFLVTLLIGVVGYCGSRKVVRLTPVEAISNTQDDGKKTGGAFQIKRNGSKSSVLLFMGVKYILKDRKTSCFVILTICLGVILFTSLSYRSHTLEVYREDTKEMWYLNGQYAMSLLSFQKTNQGVSRESAEEISQLPNVTSIKTASGIPIRVIDESGVKRNHEYYDEMNHKLMEAYGYCAVGNDGKNQVYKSILYGYNASALKELEKHVISGKRDLDNLAEDEIVLSILRTDNTKQNKLPGSFREGTPLMHYEVGDTIQIKYREDLNTDSHEYDDLSDTDEAYVYQTYKVAAIVSFAYMLDNNRTVYPLLITKDEGIQRMAPDSAYQCIYIDGTADLSMGEQIELEQQLIKIGSQNSYISTRSILSEIKQNEMFYRKQLVYIYGIAIVSFLLVLINMINNLMYRMQTRTREVCMLRGIGMSVSMIKQMLLFENLVLGMVSVALAFILSHPVLLYLYKISDMKAMGHSFQFHYSGFVMVSGVALLICVLLSLNILKGWKTKNIMGKMGRVE